MARRRVIANRLENGRPSGLGAQNPPGPLRVIIPCLISWSVTTMNQDYLNGVGWIAKAISEAILDKNYALAFTDFMRGLGMFGINTIITKSMATPPGQVVPNETLARFMGPPK